MSKRTYIYEIRIAGSGSPIDRMSFCEESEEEAEVSCNFAIDTQYPSKYIEKELVDVKEDCEKTPEEGGMAL